MIWQRKLLMSTELRAIQTSAHIIHLKIKQLQQLALDNLAKAKWHLPILRLPESPRAFLLAAGHDCLSTHLHRINILPHVHSRQQRRIDERRVPFQVSGVSWFFLFFLTTGRLGNLWLSVFNFCVLQCVHCTKLLAKYNVSMPAVLEISFHVHAMFSKQAFLLYSITEFRYKQRLNLS